jgi:hypothetical protein
MTSFRSDPRVHSWRLSDMRWTAARDRRGLNTAIPGGVAKVVLS